MGREGRLDPLAVGWLLLAVPFFVLAIAVETLLVFAVLPEEHRPRHRLRLNDALSSLACGVLNLSAGAVVLLNLAALVLRGYGWVLAHLAPWQLDARSPGAWWLCLVVVDACYYLQYAQICLGRYVSGFKLSFAETYLVPGRHRAYHHTSWLWTSHVVHHSSEEYNFTTALRQPCP